MSKLTDANARLDAALSQLEDAVGAKRAAASASAETDAENKRLQDELEWLRADFSSLKETSGTVSGRLDDAIGRLRNILAE
jgi:hypothetical protein